MTIELMPGAPLAPDVLLHQCLQTLEGTKAVIVLKVDEHGAIGIAMSRMTMHELVYASTMLRLYVDDVVTGNVPEGTWMGSAT
jgi:hypothetical protein